MVDEQKHTCLTCRVGFHSAEAQKKHFQSDWHSHNLALKSAGDPALSRQCYDDLVKSTATYVPRTCKTKSALRNNRENKKRELCIGESSVKRFSGSPLPTKKGDAHLKHRGPACKTVKATVSNASICAGTKDQLLLDAQSKKAVRREKYEPRFCFFDNFVFPTIEENVEHMETHHSLRFPDKKYLVDVTGLVEYLGRKIWEGRICLYCDAAFSSVEAVRSHMAACGHEMIGTHLGEQREELESFYDFSESYKELIPAPCTAHTGMLADSQNSIPKEFNNLIIEEEWEFLDDEPAEVEAPDGFVMVGGNLAMEAYKKLNLQPARLTDSGNLVLPTGKEIPHKYSCYNPALKYTPVNSKKPTQVYEGQLAVLQSQLRSTAIRLRSDLLLGPEKQKVPRVVVRQHKLAQARRLKLGMNANKTAQKHFVRRDVVFG